MPAFQAAWAVMQMEVGQARDFDPRMRHAFLAEGRTIGKRETMLDVGNEAGLDLASFSLMLDTDQGRKSILEEAKLGRDPFKVGGMPTLTLSDGTRLR